MAPLDERQRLLVIQLRNRVMDVVTDEFSLRDSNILRWLTMQDYNLDKAELALRKQYKWREEFNADSVHTEKFPEAVRRCYSFQIYGHDKGNRPIIDLRLGCMRAQEVTDADLIQKWSRYTVYATEKLLEAIKHNQDTLGLDECCATEICDLDGTSYKESFNKQLFSALLKIVQVLDNNFPDLLNKIIVINAPSFMDNLYRILKFVIPQRVKRRIFVFGTDSTKWKPFLLEHISKDQLSTRYGGDFQTEDEFS